MENLLQNLNINKIYTAYAVTYDENFSFEGEYHDMWEIGIIRHGKAGITSGAEVYECKKDEIVIHPSGIFHNIWAKSDEKVRILTLSFTGHGISRLVPRGKYKLNERERVLADMLEDEVAHLEFGDNVSKTPPLADGGQMVKSLLEVLFLSLSRRKEESRSPIRDTKASMFSDVVQYLEDNVDAALTVEYICARMAIGRTTLKELFKIYTGAGVMKYYNALRVKRAMALIGEGKSMSEVSEIMHFSSQNYFSSFFKRETGMSPSKYFTS